MVIKEAINSYRLAFSRPSHQLVCCHTNSSATLPPRQPEKNGFGAPKPLPSPFLPSPDNPTKRIRPQRMMHHHLVCAKAAIIRPILEPDQDTSRPKKD